MEEGESTSEIAGRFEVRWNVKNIVRQNGHFRDRDLERSEIGCRNIPLECSTRPQTFRCFPSTAGRRIGRMSRFSLRTPIVVMLLGGLVLAGAWRYWHPKLRAPDATAVPGESLPVLIYLRELEIAIERQV